MNCTLKTGKNNLEINLAYLIYDCFLIGYMIQLSYISTQYRLFKGIEIVFFLCGYLLGILQLIRQRWTKHSFIISIILIITGLLVFMLNNTTGIESRLCILNLFFVIIASKGIDFDKLIKTDLCIKIFFVILNFMLCKIGIVTNVHSSRLHNSIIRYGYGFNHANTLGSVIFLIGMYTMYLRKEKLNIADLLFQLILFLFNYKITTSKTSMIGSLFCFIFILSSMVFKHLKDKHLKKVWTFIRKQFCFSPLILISLVFIVSYYWVDTNHIMVFLNKLFTSRIEQGMKVLNYYNPTLFGNNIMRLAWSDVLNGGYNTALVGSDISYIYIYSTYGLIPLFLFTCILLFVVKCAYKLNGCAFFCVISLIIIACIENQYINVGSNIFLMLFSYQIYKKAKQITISQLINLHHR